jgi:hypothetical protein
MTSTRDLPYPSCHFDVRISAPGRSAGRVDRRGAAGGAPGFSEVLLPPLRAGQGDTDVAPSPLVLRRGYGGGLDLYEWWQQERAPGRARPREVLVDLLDEAGRPVTQWRFTGCRLVSYEFSSLNALESGLLMETVTVAFETVEMI